VHRGEMQRPNRRAQRGDAEAKSACTEGECRGQIGIHRGEMQRPNRLAQRGDAEAKLTCREGGYRGQIGVHWRRKGQIGMGEGMQRPNRHAQRDAEAKSACTEGECRGHIGMHRGRMQRPNQHAQGGDAEAKSVCTEGEWRGQIGMHRWEMQRPNQRAHSGECRGQIGMHRALPQKMSSLYTSSVEPQARPRCGLRPLMSRLPLVAIFATVRLYCIQIDVQWHMASRNGGHSFKVLGKVSIFTL
jgi:hypothetical protein